MKSNNAGFHHIGDPLPDDTYRPKVASSYEVAFCGGCENAHILLMDENGRGFAQFVLSPEQLKKINNATIMNAAVFRERKNGG